MPSWTCAATATGPDGTACGKHTGVERLRERADLLHMRDPAGDADVGTDEGDTRPLEVLGELPDRRVPLSGRDWDATLAANDRKRHDAVRRDRVLDEQGPEPRQLAAEQDGVAGAHVAVELDAEVDLPADRLADRGEARHEVVDAGRAWRMQMVVVLEEQDLQRRIALDFYGSACRRRRPARSSRCRRPAWRELLAWRSPPSSCHTGTPKCFALQVPERLVDGAERAGDRHALGS